MRGQISVAFRPIRERAVWHENSGDGSSVNEDAIASAGNAADTLRSARHAEPGLATENRDLRQRRRLEPDAVGRLTLPVRRAPRSRNPPRSGRAGLREGFTMSDGFPSMTALLGLLAVAGYQNRDKIADMLGGQAPAASSGRAGEQTSAPGGLGGLLGGAAAGGAGSFLNSGLGELLDRFTKAGHGDAASSWVNQGPNRELPTQHLEQAIGPDVLATLSQRTGLSRDELLARLARELPGAVDRYTPDGRIPG